MSITVAVDANGADLGPAEVAAGRGRRRRAQGVRVAALRPRGRDRRAAPTASRSSTRRSRSPRPPTPSPPCARTPEASIVRPPARSPTATPTRSSPAARPAPRSPPACSTSSARAGIHRPALAIPLPVPGTPVTLVDVGANTEVRAEHLVQFALHGRRARRVACSASSAPRVALLSNGEEATKGTPLVVEAHARAARPHRRGRRYDFVGNVEGNEHHRGRRRRVVTDGFTGNVALKVMEGVSEAMLAAHRASGRDRRARAQGRRRCCCARRCASSATRSTPRAPAAPTCSACAGSASSPHGRFTRRGIAQAILLAARATRGRTSSAARTPRSQARGRAAPPAAAAIRGGLYRVPRHDPRRGLHAHPRPPRRRARGRSRAHRRDRRASGRTSRPTRSTSTRSCRSSRTPTA